MAKNKKTRRQLRDQPLNAELLDRPDSDESQLELLDRLDSAVKVAHWITARVQAAMHVVEGSLDRRVRPLNADPKYAKKLMETTYIMKSLFASWSYVGHVRFHQLELAMEPLLPKFDDKDQRPSKTATPDRSAG